MKIFLSKIYVAFLIAIGFVLHGIWYILLIFPMSLVFVIDWYNRYVKRIVAKHPMWYSEWMKGCVKKFEM